MVQEKWLERYDTPNAEGALRFEIFGKDPAAFVFLTMLFDDFDPEENYVGSLLRENSTPSCGWGTSAGSGSQSSKVKSDKERRCSGPTSIPGW